MERIDALFGRGAVSAAETSGKKRRIRGAGAMKPHRLSTLTMSSEIAPSTSPFPRAPRVHLYSRSVIILGG